MNQAFFAANLGFIAAGRKPVARSGRCAAHYREVAGMRHDPAMAPSGGGTLAAPLMAPWQRRINEG